jgi:hypothetical protein
MTAFPAIQARIAQDPAANGTQNISSDGGMLRAAKKVTQRIKNDTIPLAARDAERVAVALSKTKSRPHDQYAKGHVLWDDKPHGWALALHTARMSKLSMAHRVLDKVGVEQRKEMRQVMFSESNLVQNNPEEKRRTKQVVRLYRAASRDDMHEMFNNLGLESIPSRIRNAEYLMQRFG